MTYDEARDFLASLVNYEQQTPSATDLALHPIRALLCELGNPHHRLKIVHVAGTNGKGSLAAMLDEILQQAGYRTGMYTSPALCKFEERIRVSGAPISSADCAEHISQIHGIITRDSFRLESPRHPTYFDVVTAMAFLHFALMGIDIAIVEVGLGGKSDSTNVCDPILSLIASISYDHTAQLGNSLHQIAAEKAGIIKPGRPAISGVMAEEAQEVMQTTCQECGSQLMQLEVHFNYTHTSACLSDGVFIPARVAVNTSQRNWPTMDLRLLGEHQAANAALAVVAVEQLQRLGFAISDLAVSRGLERVRCPARIELLAHQPTVVLDCSHNPAAVRALLTTLAHSFPDQMGPQRKQGTKRFLIFGASRDKDLSALLAILAPHFDVLYFTSYKRSRRSATQADLEAALQASDSNRSYLYTSGVAEAFLAVAATATADDFICVTGSVFLAGEFLSFWTDQLSASHASE